MTKDRIGEMTRLMLESKMSGEAPEPIPEETSESITNFLEQIQCCRDEIQNMRDQIQILKTFHNQIQRCINESLRKDMEDKVEEKKATIASSLTAVRNNVKSIQEIFSQKKISPALRRMKEVQLSSLVRTLNEITEEYYSCLVDHSEKCKKLLYDMINIADDDRANVEELIQNGKVAFFTNNLLLNELEQKVNFREIEDRHADILKVEKSIIELKNLTQDLNLVVAVQAENVDLVEKHVQKTAKKVDDTVTIIQAASKLRNRARKRKLIISLMFFAILFILIFVICWI